ncbi:54S ribosomal protein L35, mitochondrial [Phlyctema vagabunda]|uniref:54S ribosomal protein L35, mitochondrial n=1 Tax=Phlyctema vagabunda TaxID=108571 RepID=A0ABR4PIU4_9HELO
MPACQKAVRPLAQCLRGAQASSSSMRMIRAFSTTPQTSDAAAEIVSTPEYDPATVTSVRGEKTLMRSGIMPVGSRRRRAALDTSDNVPFEQLPYQCFQEARKVLQEDREEKLKAIATERLRIQNLMAQDPEKVKGGQVMKDRRLAGMRQHLAHLKIMADINDPMIKKRFEDGEGDMSKSIYRFLADKKWRSYQRKIIVQRIDQLNIVPDVLPHFEPTAEVRVAFRRRNVQPGEFVDSRVSEVPPRLNIQVFNQGERFVTILVLDTDVPLIEEDDFTTRCHYLAVNIPLGPTDDSVPLSQATAEQLVQPWLPPFAQKGSPYHRLSIFVLEQAPGEKINVEEVQKLQRDGFRFRSFVNKNKLEPIGLGIFRSIWDEGTAGVMHRACIEGADIEFKRKKVIALKPKQKPRGWEARHASDKYKSLRR